MTPFFSVFLWKNFLYPSDTGYAVALIFKAHQANALGVAAGFIHGIEGQADHLSFFGNNNNIFVSHIVGVNDISVDQLAGLRGDFGGFYAGTAASLQFIVVKRGALAESLLHY